MISKWYQLKEEAINLRSNGHSINFVETKLGIPRSTLSNWFKTVNIDEKYKKILEANRIDALKNARKKAVKWHNAQKISRLYIAEEQAKKIIEGIDFNKKEILELAFSMLYLGEGFKKKLVTGMGNSDPMILIFFITVLKKLYKIETKEISCFLHLRADQDPEEMIFYWSKKLGIPIQNFGKTSIDKRTIGSKTYDTYKGVCVVRCGNVAIQRKLIYLSRIYCEKIIHLRA